MDLAHTRQDSIQDLTIGGLRVCSDLPLPGLLPWTGAADHGVDLHIAIGPVPDLDRPIVNNPLLQIDAHGTCRFAMPGVAAYRVSADGRSVIVEPSGADDATEVRTFLFGTVIAIVFIRRDLLPLHASSVQVGGRAIAFAGASGAGKSMLAAGLAARGFALLADDVTAIELSGDGPPVARPGPPGVTLWRDAMDRMGAFRADLEPVRPGLERYHLAVGAQCARALPLAALIHLEGAGDGPPGVRRLDKMAGMARIPSLLYRQRMTQRMGLEHWQMRHFLKLLGALGGIHAVRRPRSEQEWDALAVSVQAMVCAP